MTKRFVHPKEGITPRNADTLNFYTPGTLTAKTVYSNPALTTSISQPIAADLNGMFPSIYMASELHRVIMKRASGVQVYDEDNYDSGVPAGTDVDGSVLPVLLGGTGATTPAGARGQLGAASATTVTLLSTEVSGHSTLIDTGLHTDGDRFGTLATLDSVGPEQLAANSLVVCCKRARDITPSADTITTTTPAADDTIPQVGEGVELFSTAFTPTRDDTTIRVRVVVYAQGATDITAVIALFKNGTGNAVAAKTHRYISQGQTTVLEYEEAPGSTSEITYSVRIGVAGSTLRINGVGGDDLGTTPAAGQTSFTIEEWYAS